MALFPNNREDKRVPRKIIDYPAGRKSRFAKTFGWWRNPTARLYVIAGQMSVLHNNPDIRAHAEFTGEGPRSVAYILVERMRKMDPELYAAVAETCVDQRRSEFDGVVHKLYERIHKVGVVPELHQKGKNEHYAHRHNPATEAEIKRASRMVVRP